GGFHSLGGSGASLIVRLNENGGVDGTFHSPILAYTAGLFSSPRVLTVAVDLQGRIYLAGQFDRIDGKECQGLVRLQPDGTHDPSFEPTIEFAPYPVG